MKVLDVMTKEPIVAEVPGRRDDVLRLLVTHDVSGLPVVESGSKRLAGVISRSDIFRNPEEEQVALLMTKSPLTVGADDELADAARILVQHRVHGLPVISRRKDLQGVISPTDVLRVLQEGFDEPIAPLVARSVAPAYEETPLPVVWATMNLTGQNALPVLNARAKLCGIVADSDLFKKSQVDEASAVTVLGLGSDRDRWSWDAFRSLMPLYYATSRVELPADPIRDIMTRDVATAFNQTTVAEAARKMLKHHVQQLPVIDADDALLGMVTDLDLLRVVYEGKGLTGSRLAKAQKRLAAEARAEAIVEPTNHRRASRARMGDFTIPPLPRPPVLKPEAAPATEGPTPKKAAPGSARLPVPEKPPRRPPVPRPPVKKKAAPKPAKKKAKKAPPKRAKTTSRRIKQKPKPKGKKKR